MCKTYINNRGGSESGRRVDLYNTGAVAYRQEVVRDSMCTIYIYILIYRIYIYFRVKNCKSIYC